MREVETGTRSIAPATMIYREFTQISNTPNTNLVIATRGYYRLRHFTVCLVRSVQNNNSNCDLNAIPTAILNQRGDGSIKSTRK